MTDQQAREFVEMLAVPEAPEPPPCPICGCGHPLETRCAHLTDRRPGAAGLREQARGRQTSKDAIQIGSLDTIAALI